MEGWAGQMRVWRVQFEHAKNEMPIWPLSRDVGHWRTRCVSPGRIWFLESWSWIERGTGRRRGQVPGLSCGRVLQHLEVKQSTRNQQSRWRRSPQRESSLQSQTKKCFRNKSLLRGVKGWVSSGKMKTKLPLDLTTWKWLPTRKWNGSLTGSSSGK